MSNNIRVLLPHSLDGNIYIRELGQAYRKAGCELIYGIDNFLECTVNVGMIHLHWPEAFYRWTGGGAIESRARRFLDAIDQHKANGAKIVWTIHNLIPHEHPDSKFDRDIYQQVLDRADLLVHHCPASNSLLAAGYQIGEAAAHTVIPHGHYLGYPHGIAREDARRRLGIPADAYVYLQFGMIRGYKGLNSLLDAWRRVKSKNKWLLVAGKYQPPTGRFAWREKLRMAWALRNPRITMHLDSVPQEEIQIYLAAADSMVLTHARGLNSGVAVLAMTFGKLVIAPRLGCIEWVLDSGANLGYATGSREALIAAMERAPGMDASAVGKTNMAVAASWRWEDMARGILDHPALALCPSQ